MKMGMRGAAASVLILAMGATGTAMSQQPAARAAVKETSTLNTQREKLGYAIGIDVANSFGPISSEIDLAALRRGVTNAFEGKQPLISQEEAQKTDAALRQAVMAKSGQPVPGVAPGTAPPRGTTARGRGWRMSAWRRGSSSTTRSTMRALWATAQSPPSICCAARRASAGATASPRCSFVARRGCRSSG